jgi:hypothetical protein
MKTEVSAALEAVEEELEKSNVCGYSIGVIRAALEESPTTAPNSAMDAIAMLAPQYVKQFKLDYSVCADITEFLIWARQQHQ